MTGRRYLHVNYTRRPRTLHHAFLIDPVLEELVGIELKPGKEERPMRLIDLNPHWWAHGEGRSGQGFTFDCPHCIGKPKGVKIAVALANPLDGGARIDLSPAVLWPVLWPEGAPNTVTVPPGVHWQRTGDTFETLTLMPSVDASKSGHWHGFITNGEVR